MLSLKIDGKPVDLSEDFSITMNLKSPIFNEPGSYSYPFKLPPTARNKIALNFPHKVASVEDVYKEYKGVLSWNKNTLFSGTMKIKTAGDQGYEGYLMEGNGDFNYLRKKLTMQDIDFGTLEFSWEGLRQMYINSCGDKAYPLVPVTFPQIMNKTYFDEEPTDPHQLYFNYYENGQVGQYNPLTGTFDGVIVPMLYLKYVLKKIFAGLQYAAVDLFFDTDPDFDRMALYNSVDCNSGLTGFFAYNKQLLLLNYHVPRMGLNDFFTGLETFFNIRIFYNSNTRTARIISLDTIIKETDYIDFSSRIISFTIEPDEKITGFYLKMNMDTDDESYQQSKEEEQTLIDQIKPSVQSISDLKAWPASQIYDRRYVHDTDEWYVMDTDKTWHLDNTFYYSLALSTQSIYKDKDQNIETKFSSLKSDLNAPYYAVIGNARDKWKDVTPKLFFSRYIQSSGDNKVLARFFTDTNSLFYSWDTGIVNKYYKAFLDFRINTKRVKIKKLMTFSELQNFDFSKKYMIFGIKYLVSSIQVTIKRDRIMEAELECYSTFDCPLIYNKTQISLQKTKLAKVMKNIVKGYCAKIEQVSDSLIYKGYPDGQVSENSPLWAIERITIDQVTGMTEVKWASGTTECIYRWSERTSLNYDFLK